MSRTYRLRNFPKYRRYQEEPYGGYRTEATPLEFIRTRYVETGGPYEWQRYRGKRAPLNVLSCVCGGVRLRSDLLGRGQSSKMLKMYDNRKGRRRAKAILKNFKSWDYDYRGFFPQPHRVENRWNWD